MNTTIDYRRTNCCAMCRYYTELNKYTYTEIGEFTEWLDGYACTANAYSNGEGWVTQMVNIDERHTTCGYWAPRSM